MEILGALGVIVLFIVALAIKFVAVPWAIVFVLGAFGISISFWVAFVSVLLFKWLVTAIKN